MNEFKNVPKQFKCSLTNKTVIVDCTYQTVSGMGSDEVSDVLLKRRCRTNQQCALAGQYDNCPLKGVPFE